MQLVNWTGAVFGPGSEWLWAFLQFIVVVVSLAGIYRQLRLQGAANTITLAQSLEAQWASPQMAYTRLELLVHIRAGHTDLRGFGMAMDIIAFFAMMDRLERAGAMSMEHIAVDWGEALTTWHELIAPTLAAIGIPEAFEALDAFEQRVRRYAAKHDITLPGAGAFSIDQRIAWVQRDLARDYAIQRGEMPPDPAPAPAAAG